MIPTLKMVEKGCSLIGQVQVCYKKIYLKKESKLSKESLKNDQENWSQFDICQNIAEESLQKFMALDMMRK